jgi:chromosomal replication initiation ATPase DnaA
MAEPPRQLALDLPVEPNFDPDDFLVSPSNEAAYAAIEAWPDWTDRIRVLTGPAGSGKSHLGAVWRARSHAWTLGAAEVGEADVPHLVSSGALLLEDCDRGGLREAALFHLVNAARERGCFVLLTGRRPPGEWGLATADLVSRLRLAPLSVLDAPDDALLKAIFVKLFVERQLVVDTSLVDYLALRIDRSVPAARAIVERLDREALARRRRISRALVADVLREFGAGEETGKAST